MKLFQLLLLAGVLTIVSCSKGSSDTEEKSTDATSLVEDEADFIVDADDSDLIIEEEPVLADTEESEPVLLEEPIASSEAPQQIESVDSGNPVNIEEATYTAKRGETLMMVAFNIYGDYRKWKEIAALNGITGGMVAAGANIRYQKPLREFVWNPEGMPYLIKSGDTLASISNEKYGTVQKWRSIYNNNKPLIKDPNLIFAGFTLYYIPQRDIASE